MRAVAFADVMDSENIRVVKRSYCARLLFKTAEAVGVESERFMEDFQSNVATQTGILGAIDLAHAAGTQRRVDFIRSKFRAGS